MLGKIKELVALQGKLAELKRQLAASSIDLEWFSGKVKMRINGAQEVQSLKIDQSLLALDSDLASKLASCFNEAILKSQALAAQKTKQIVGINIPGF